MTSTRPSIKRDPNLCCGNEVKRFVSVVSLYFCVDTADGIRRDGSQTDREIEKERKTIHMSAPVE